MTVYGSIALNSGSYYGSGYSGGFSGNRVASSTNINRVSRDIASGYSQDLELIQTYLKEGKTEQAFDMYNGLFEDVKYSASNYGYSLTDSNVETILNNAYVAATGSTLLDSVNKTTASPFLSGLAQGVPVVGWIFANGVTTAEATSQLADQNTNWKDKVAEYTGAAMSGAASGAIIGSFIPVIGTGIGAGIGAVAGCVSTLLKDLF